MDGTQSWRIDRVDSPSTRDPGHEADCIVVGAGIVGAACALACAEAGLRVAVLERGAVGGGATAAAMGHTVLMSDSPAQFALTWRSQQLWEALAPRLPSSAEYQRIGTLWIAADLEEMGEVERQHASYAQLGVASSVYGAAQLAEVEPNLRSPLAGALYMPGDGVVDPSAVAAWLLEQAVLRGATLVQGRALAAGQGKVALEDGRLLRASSIVLATGVDGSELIEGLAAALPLRKRKGHLMITGPCPGFLHHQVVELGYLKTAHQAEADSVACNLQPRANGQLLIGSSRQYGSETADLEPPVLAAILARAAEYVPRLRELPIERSWTGFRAATPDHLPLIGPAAGLDGIDDPTLYLATGHEGLGITTSLATAELLVDSLLGRPGVLAPAPYLPARLKAETPAAAQPAPA